MKSVQKRDFSGRANFETLLSTASIADFNERVKEFSEKIHDL
jgi:hypothetical protein